MWPLKIKLGNPLLIVSICMGKKYQIEYKGLMEILIRDSSNFKQVKEKFIPNILKDFRSAPFYIHCISHMANMRMFPLYFLHPLTQRTMICHNFDLLMLYILTLHRHYCFFFYPLSSDKCEFNSI